MYEEIGKLLGSTVAHLEADLRRDVGDSEVLQKLALASESVRNLTQSNLAGFQHGFAMGYELAAKNIEELEYENASNFGTAMRTSIEDGP